MRKLFLDISIKHTYQCQQCEAQLFSFFVLFGFSIKFIVKDGGSIFLDIIIEDASSFGSFIRSFLSLFNLKLSRKQESMMTAAYFSDFKNKDKSEKEISEKLLIDDVNNNGSFETNKRKMSGMKSLSIYNIEILVNDKIFGMLNDYYVQ